MSNVIETLGDILQRMRGQLADSTSDFAYKIVRDYINELGDVEAALSAQQARTDGGEVVGYQRALELIGDAYNAGTHGIGYSQQATDLFDARIGTNHRHPR